MAFTNLLFQENYNEIQTKEVVAYQVDLAQKKYHQRQANKPKSIRLTQEIRDFITQWIKEDYSPEQILGMLKYAMSLVLALSEFINLFGKTKSKAEWSTSI